LRAAELAGYAREYASQSAYQLLRSPNVLATLRFEMARRVTSLAPLGLSVIEALVRDTATPAKIRLDGAKTLLDRAGWIAPRATIDKTGADISLHEMTVSDLRSLADKLESELATRATSANNTQGDSEAIDSLT
jgi:phage terminase small subunit